MSYLFRKPVLVIDSETTGLPRDSQAQPWEIAGVLLDRNGVEVETREILGKPALWHQKMARIVALGGYTAEQLLRQPPLASMLPGFRGWIDTLAKDGLIVTSFNVEFDSEMLARVDLKPAWGKCVMRLAWEEMGPAGALPWNTRRKAYKFPNLGEAAAFYDIPREGAAHRALADARVAAGVAVALHRERVRRRAGETT
jgi:DNA polymerase III epsilon subunit-like protein